jgi:hypothetical protein
MADLEDSLIMDGHDIANVSKDLHTLAQIVDQVRLHVQDADTQLRVGTYGVSSFGDRRAGSAIDTLNSNTRAVAINVKGSLDDLHRSLSDAAAALDRIAKAVHDTSRDHTRQLKQLLDTAFGERPATPSAPAQAAPVQAAPVQAAPTRPRPRRP